MTLVSGVELTKFEWEFLLPSLTLVRLHNIPEFVKSFYSGPFRRVHDVMLGTKSGSGGSYFLVCLKINLEKV